MIALFGTLCLNIVVFFFSLLLLLEIASDCHELFLRGETTSGVYTIQPMNAEPFKVYCEMTAGKQSKTLSHFLSRSVQLDQQLLTKKLQKKLLFLLMQPFLINLFFSLSV